MLAACGVNPVASSPKLCGLGGKHIGHPVLFTPLEASQFSEKPRRLFAHLLMGQGRGQFMDLAQAAYEVSPCRCSVVTS